MEKTDLKVDKRIFIGKSGEELAVRYLELSGYIILSRNYRCKIGEIDIIASKNEVLTFVEVKTRLSTSAGHPAEAVTFRKQQRIRRCAEFYLLTKGLLEHMPLMSFDVIEIVKKDNRIILFNHYPNCF